LIERTLSLAAWFASMAVAYFWPEGNWLVLATTINLLHYRFVDWWCGASLRTRVMNVLKDELTMQHTMLAEMRKDVDDIKESQNKMISSFRTGRSLPG
jgi:hypothetical protein